MSTFSGPVSERAFTALKNVDVEAIDALEESEVRAILPSLVRMALCVPIDNSDEWLEKKKRILIKLSSIDTTNIIISLLSADFHSLDTDVRKEIAIRSKGVVPLGETPLSEVMTGGLALEFEKSEGIRKFRLVLSELFAVQTHSRSQAMSGVQTARSSELFDCDVYLEEVSDVLAIAAAELPSSLMITDVAEILLFMRKGPDLICRLIANFPESFLELASSLIWSGDKLEEESFTTKNRIRTLRLLCQMNPNKALVLRSIAVEACKMPGLAVLITIDYDKIRDEDGSNTDCELISFISGILLTGDEKVKTWFGSYLRTAQKKIEHGQVSTLNNLRKELLNSLKQVCHENPSDTDTMRVCSLLRLYSAMRSVGNFRFTDEEQETILSIITSCPPATAAGVKMVSLSLCFLISLPSLIANSDQEKKAIQWLKKLVKDETYFGNVGQVKSSFEETILLIAIHFHSGQISAISDLVCSILGMKVQVRGSNLGRMKILFTQHVFTEEMVASHAVKVPVTHGLSSNIQGFLSIHCIYQLLRSRSFAKYQVPIKDWIFKQICQSSTPLHSVLPSVIESFVNSILVPVTKSGHCNQAITEEEVKHVFKWKLYSSDNICEDDQPISILSSQLLMLYYLLLYQDVRLTQCKVHGGTNDHPAYRPELMSQIPVHFLLQSARKDPDNYSAIFPPLLRLVSSHLPHLCLVTDWMHSHPDHGRRYTDHILSGKLRDVGEKLPESSTELVVILEELLASSQTRQWSFGREFVSIIPFLLRRGVSRLVREKANKFWWSLNSVFPDELWVETINVLRDQSLGKLTRKDIVHDPLHVLRCDSRVFRCPELVDIVLHILSSFIAASKTLLNHHLMEKPSKSSEEEKDREELKVALIAAQESASIQILLEVCLPRDEECDTGLLNPLREVQGLICTHLHQVFIADPNLVKLVHFQTYNSDLISLTVSAIPSMHIVLDFLPELLCQPDMDKQIFAIELCSYLCLQYSITKSLCVAKLCFSVSNTLMSLLSGCRRSSFFIPVLPSLVRMCRAFPPLKEDALALVNQLKQISVSKLAATSCTFVSPKILFKVFSQSKEKYNDKRSWKRFMSSLTDDEALYLIVQQSLEELKCDNNSILFKPSLYTE